MNILGQQNCSMHSKKSHTNQLGFTYFNALRSINLFEISPYFNVFQVANTYLIG